MTPWAADWENNAQRYPDAVAITNAYGQKSTYSELSARAWELEHRLRAGRVAAGDRVMMGITAGEMLDDAIVQLWACGLLGAVWCPDWAGFTARQVREWGLTEAVIPRMRIHPHTNEEEVFGIVSPGWHDSALVWPERALDGGGRDRTPVVMRKVSHAHLAHGIACWRRETGIEHGDKIAWMDAGMCGLSWLSVFAALSVGAHLLQWRNVQCHEEIFSAHSRSKPIRWIVASPRWLSRLELPWTQCPQGILAPWGVATPSQRWRWCEKTRWVEVWDPASCGWWWGHRQFQGIDRDEVSLDACSTYFPWKVDHRGGYLWVMGEEQWSPLAMGSMREHRFFLGACGIANHALRQRGEAICRLLRAQPSIGGVSCVQIDGHAHIALLPRSELDNATHILELARKVARDADAEAVDDFRWAVCCGIVPRDERGAFSGAGLVELLRD